MRWFGIILLGLLAAGCWVMAFNEGRESFAFQSHAVRVPGVISGYAPKTCTTLDKNKKQKSYTCYEVLVRYEVQGVTRESPVGEERTTTTSSQGKAVQLLADVHTEPAQVHFDDLGIWIRPMILSVFGVVLAGAVIVLLRS